MSEVQISGLVFWDWFADLGLLDVQVSDNKGKLFVTIKLQPAICPLSQHVIRFHELPAVTTQRFIQ